MANRRLQGFVDPGNLEDEPNTTGPEVEPGRQYAQNVLHPRRERAPQGPFTPATTSDKQFVDPGNLEPAEDREKVLSEQYVVTDPDKFAETMRKSRLTRLLPSQVEDNPQLETQLKAGELRGKLETAPITRRWMNSDPANGQLAHDEADDMGWAEKHLRLFWGGAIAQSAAIRESVDTIVGAPSDAFNSAVDSLLGVTPEDDRAQPRGPVELAQDTADAALRWMGYDIQGQASDIPPDMSVGRALAGIDQDQVVTVDQFKQEPLRNFFPLVFQTLAESGSQMLTGAGPGGLSVLTLTQLGLQSQQRAKNQGRDEATVGDMLAVAPTSFGSAFLERLGARGVFGLTENLTSASVRGVARATLGGAATEAGTEATQSLLENLGTRAFTEAGYDGAEALDEALIGGLIGFGAGGTVRSITAVPEAGFKARTARQRANAVKQINQRAPNLRARDADAYASWQGELMRAQGADSVTISDEGIGVLRQALSEEVEATGQTDPLRDMLGEQLDFFSRQARSENAATGAGVTISPERFWRLPQSVVDKIADHTSFREGTLSAVEAENVESLLRELKDSEVQTEAQRRREAAAEEDAILQTVRDRLIDSGGALSDPASADAAARQMAAAFQTLAERSGTPIDQVRDRFLPAIEKSFETGGPQVFTASEEQAQQIAEQFPGAEITEATAEGNRRVIVPQDSVDAVQQAFPDARQATRQQTQPGRGEARGSIDLRDMENIVIRLYRAENMSTFLHESGHLYLEMLGALAEQPDASPHLKQDFQTVLDWLGVQSRQEITSEHHEKWAETYEAYLREGRAPSTALREAFNKFTAWLSTIYRRIRETGRLPRAALTDDIRRVMDRILATDEAITEVREQQRLLPAFQDAESAGMTQQEYEEYTEQVRRARDAAHTELVQEAMREVEREKAEWWREERKQEEQTVLQRLDDDLVWRARYIIQRNNLPSGAPLPDGAVAVGKLDRDLAQSYGYDLPGGNQLLRRGGVHPDRAAQDLGFTSGDHLLQALSNMPRGRDGKFLTEREFARQQAEQVLRERHGDIMDVAELEQAALRRVHSRQQADIITRELEVLRKQTGETRRISNAVARRAAERTIRNKPMREVASPTKYLNAERKFAIQATEAVARGDLETAYDAKRKQLLNFHMYREARDVRASAEQMSRRLKKWQRLKSDGKNVHPEFVQQVRELLAPVNFRSRVGERRFQRLTAETLNNWAEQKAKEFGAAFHISKELDDALTKQHVSEMTFTELEGLHDTARSIVKQGQKYTDAEEAQFKSVVNNLVDSIEDNRLSGKTKAARRDRNFWDRVRAGGRQYFAEMRTMSSIARQLDGGKEGPVWNTVFRRIKDADDRYIDRGMQASAQINEILKRYSVKERTAFLRKTYIPELQESWSLNARLSFALNMGNPGNVEAIQNEYTATQIDAVLATLTDKDWDTVEQIWGFIDQFWPEVKALEERTTGVAPAKVEASPFTVTTADGNRRQLAGGYYPLRADPMRSKGGKEDFREASSLDGMMGGGRAQAATQHGHTIERQGFGNDKKVWMDLRVLFDHVDTVIKDIEMREAVHEVNRIVNSRPFANAVSDVMGKEFQDVTEAWLENTVGGLNQQPITTIEKVAQWFRQGVSMAEMGFSLRTILQQPFGLTQTVALIGEADTAKGVLEFAAGRGAAWRKVMDASAFMRNRAATMNRDVRDAQNLVGVQGLTEPVVRASFKGIQMLDAAVSVPTWLAAYERSKKLQAREGGVVSEADAISYADDIVSRTQGSGLPRDLSNIQQGSPWKKMFTMFYSFFNAYYNVNTDLVKEFQRRGGVRNPNAILRLALAQFWVTIIPALVVDYLFNEPPEDEDEYLGWAMGSLGGYYATGLVGVRDIANSAISGYSYQATPVASVPTAILRTAQQFEQGEVDQQLLTNLLMAAGYTFHIPGARQGTRLIDYGFEEGLDELDSLDAWWKFTVTGPEE